ncbi:MAG: hypothetical protein ACI8QQ_002500, partial [Psychroserpens sp.]
NKSPESILKNISGTLPLGVLIWFPSMIRLYTYH